ncbi:MAG: hypothetical protein EOM16_02895 [Bacteroidia bacterium]|nr:hypothetical protein [Bacteroidia bacterium]
MMKNKSLILISLGILLSSCATTNRYASATFEDAIYQTPGATQTVVVNTNLDKELEALRGKTRESNSVIIDGRVVEGVYADQNGNVDIDASEDKTYIILNPGETFEERLTKFDNPTYTINFTYDAWDLYNPWIWDIFYNPYGSLYWRSRWYSAWSPYRYYNSWYSWHSPWFSPWNSYWHSYNSFYWGAPYYGYYDPWYHYNSYHWGHYAPYYPSYGNKGRDRFYGRRVSESSYGQSGNRASSSGSLIRRQSVRTSQVRGASTQISSESLNDRYSQSIYRRGDRNPSQTTNNQIRESYQSTRRSSSVTRESNGVVRRSSGETGRTSGVVRQTNGSAGRTSGVTRRSSGVVNRTSGTVRQSSGTTRQPASQYRQSTTRQNSGNTNYRSSSSGSQRGSIQRSESSSRSTYTPPTRSSSYSRSSGSSSSGSSSRSGGSSSSSSSSSSRSGNSSSGYRR